MVLVNVPNLHGVRKLHGFVAIGTLAAAIAAPSGCSDSEFSGCKASRTCKPTGGAGGTSGTGGTEGGAGNDTGGSSGSSSSGTGGSSGSDDGGAGTGGAGDDTDPPTIVSFSPDDGDVDVERDVEVTATFSEPIDERSVTQTNVVLTGPDGDVDGTVSVDDNVVTFVAEKPLYLLGDYTLTIGDEVADLAGNTLGEEASVAFKVRDGRWSEPVYPFGETVPRYVSLFERNLLGDVVVTLERDSNPRTAVHSAVYDAGEGDWTIPAEVRSASSNIASHGLGLDRERRAVVASCGAGCAWSRYTDAGGWVDAGALPGSMALGVAQQGTATALWQDSAGAMTSQLLNLSSGTLFDATAVPGLNGTLQALIASSLDRVGIVSVQPLGSSEEMTVTWRNGSTWHAPEPLATAVQFGNVAADSDERGNIVVVWHEGDELRSRLYNRSKDEWTPELTVTSVPPATYVYISRPDMTAGNAVISFNTFEPDAGTWVAVYQSDAGWIRSSIVKVDAEFSGGLVAVAMSKSGHALASWHEEFKFSRFAPESGWGDVQSLQADVNPYYMWAAARADGTVLVASNCNGGSMLVGTPCTLRFE